MKMRKPAIPLITIDPYFSVWSYDELNKSFPFHWTGSRNTILGTVNIDGEVYRFLGDSCQNVLEQVSENIDAVTTVYTFKGAGILLTAEFTSPMLVSDLYYSSRPVSYLKLSYESTDGQPHTVSARLSCSEELVLNKAGEGRALGEKVDINGVSAIRIGKAGQKILWRSGDDIRIDWGYFYLAVRGKAALGEEIINDLYSVYAETELDNSALFLLAYDDIQSIVYFGEKLNAYWKKDGKTIEEAISQAAEEYENLFLKCKAFSNKLYSDAEEAGGTEYAELLMLAYRQVMAAHKLVVDTEGNNLYISKECNSNGCAATVDVTYPSAPMYLLYNTELLKAMLRPVFRYSKSSDWSYDFAPHDIGTYPLLNGQVYSAGSLVGQMPVEECGNMLILVDEICRREKDYSLAAENIDLLKKWSEYLIKYGEDPENQLCTDDFAGHLSHNVNLAIKAVMGLEGFSDILAALGEKHDAERLDKTARAYADSICSRAKNSDGSYRLAFDRADTFSLKYNSVWDKLWKTEIFPNEFYEGEIKRYKKEVLPYGVPLDSRKKYTKSDWEIWVACLSADKETFELFVHLLYSAYNTMHTRVPMTDYYHADIANMVEFRHRSVQGGLFIKLLFDKF